MAILRQRLYTTPADYKKKIDENTELRSKNHSMLTFDLFSPIFSPASLKIHRDVVSFNFSDPYQSQRIYPLSFS